MDIVGKIKILMELNNWTEYQLAKRAGLSQSTVNSMFRKNNTPTIPTLECICRAFGMSLSAFFAEDEPKEAFSPDQLNLFEEWLELSEEQKEILRKFVAEKNKSE